MSFPAISLALISLLFPWSSPTQIGRSAPQQIIQQCDSSIICPGEELLYEVRYLGVKLGTVRIFTLADDTTGSRTRYRAAALIDSYNGIPFVDIHAIDSTIINTEFESQGFHAFEKRGDTWLEDKSTYDLPNHRVIIEKSNHTSPLSPPLGPTRIDTVMIPGSSIQDGLSLLFFARANARKFSNVRIPAVVYGKLGYAGFRFHLERSQEEIDAIKDKKIRVVGFEGNAEFKGLYGMTGDFSGWFSDDPACIPIKAELGVFIGNVKIELIRWKRAGWSPPVSQ